MQVELASGSYVKTALRWNYTLTTCLRFNHSNHFKASLGNDIRVGHHVERHKDPRIALYELLLLYRTMFWFEVVGEEGGREGGGGGCHSSPV